MKMTKPVNFCRLRIKRNHNKSAVLIYWRCLFSSVRCAMVWNPDQYHLFQDHRLRPALDLISQLPLQSPSIIYDLGCGSGNVTAYLSRQWENAVVTGIDNSPQMLEKARDSRAPRAVAHRSIWVRWASRDTPSLDCSCVLTLKYPTAFMACPFMPPPGLGS